MQISTFVFIVAFMDEKVYNKKQKKYHDLIIETDVDRKAGGEMKDWISCPLEAVNFGSREKGERISAHDHSAYEMVYYVRGSGYTTIHGKRYEFSPGMCALIEPGHMHDEFYKEKGYVIYAIFGGKEKLEGLGDCVFHDQEESLYQQMEGIRKEFFSGREYKEWKLKLLVQMLLVELARNRSHPKQLEGMEGCISYMNEFCAEKMDFQKLAADAGYSYSHFRRLVKEMTGESPINYVIGCRLKRAKYLLKYTSLPIAHISQECGFSTESQFCSMFRRSFGLTPKGYRKQELGDAKE